MGWGMRKRSWTSHFVAGAVRRGGKSPRGTGRVLSFGSQNPNGNNKPTHSKLIQLGF